MNLNIKAAVLSAFVLPGLGQLVNGKKLKGFVLITIVNIFILVAMAFVLKGMGQLVVTMKAGGPVDAAAVLEQVRQNSGRSPRWLLAGFLGIWLYAVVDALVDRPKVEVEIRKTE
jgi:TM2 domain-containing membrane protein YozV